MIRPGKKPLVYLISDGTMTDSEVTDGSSRFLDLVRTAVSFRIPLIQIREKQLTAKSLFALTQRVVEVSCGSRTRILVNDRLDIALAAGASGVHLTSRSVPAHVIRPFVPADFLIGISAHSIDELGVDSPGADFVVLAPIFRSPGKGVPIGVDRLREAVRAYPYLPILGLGGVDSTNYRDILETGAAGFAAIRFLNDAANLEKINLELAL